MNDDDEVDIFDFDDNMETEAQVITVDSDDSFDAGPTKTSFVVEPKVIVERYQALKDESKRLDDVAREVRSLLLICRQMEECYCKRVNQKDKVASKAEIRQLHDGTAILLITIHNITDQPLDSWSLSVSPSPIYPHSLASCSQSIPLGIIHPGIQKTFECHVARDFCEPPILLQLALIKEFELEEIRKVFHVDIDPICVTAWDQVQIAKEPRELNTGFTSTIRLPNPLLNLLSGCPDTPPTIQNILKAILNLDVSPEGSQVVLALTAPDALFRVSCSKDGAAFHSLTIATESSRSHELLVEHLRLRLIMEMSKLKSRPKKGGGAGGISILAEMEAGSVEALFQSMLAAFH